MYTQGRAYLEYFSFDTASQRERVRYYEENEGQIRLLDYDEKLELDMDYCLCLFEIGRYHRFLDKVDPVIEAVIAENIFEYMSVPIFEDLLFKKAACYHNLYQFHKAEKILIQVLRISPQHDGAMTLLAYCKQKSEKDLFVMFKALAVVCLFMAVSITLARIILIEPFYDKYMLPFLWIRNILLVCSALFLLIQEVIINVEIHRETGRFSWPFLNHLKKRFFS